MLADQKGDSRIKSFSLVTRPVGPLPVHIETEDGGECLACFPTGCAGCVKGRKTSVTLILLELIGFTSLKEENRHTHTQTSSQLQREGAVIVRLCPFCPNFQGLAVLSLLLKPFSRLNPTLHNSPFLLKYIYVIVL
jgi:hypothetical protein